MYSLLPNARISSTSTRGRGKKSSSILAHLYVAGENSRCHLQYNSLRRCRTRLLPLRTGLRRVSSGTRQGAIRGVSFRTGFLVSFFLELARRFEGSSKIFDIRHIDGYRVLLSRFLCQLFPVFSSCLIRCRDYVLGYLFGLRRAKCFILNGETFYVSV